MGKRKRRIRVLKECNRSKRLSKIIGRALAGVIDPSGGNFRNPLSLMLEDPPYGIEITGVARAIDGFEECPPVRLAFSIEPSPPLAHLFIKPV